MRFGRDNRRSPRVHEVNLGRDPSVAPYEGPTLLGSTVKACWTVDLRYFDPPGYLIRFTLPLPLSKGKGGAIGAFRSSTTTERSEAPPVRPEPAMVKESPPIHREEERLGPMMKASNKKKNLTNLTLASRRIGRKRDHGDKDAAVPGIKPKKPSQEKR